MPHELGVSLRGDGPDLLGEAQGDRAAMRPVHAHAQRSGVQVARLGGPLLALTLVRRQLEHATIGEPVRLVAVQDRLHEILTRWHLGELPCGPSEGAIIEHHGLSRRHRLDVQAEDIRARQRFIRTDVFAGLARKIAAQQQDQATIQRFMAPLRRETDRKGGPGTMGRVSDGGRWRGGCGLDQRGTSHRQQQRQTPVSSILSRHFFPKRYLNTDRGPGDLPHECLRRPRRQR